MAAGRYTSRTIGSKPTPRDEKTEKVRDTLKNPYGKKQETKKDDQR